MNRRGWLAGGVAMLLALLTAIPAAGQTDYLTGVQTLADTVANLGAEAQEANRAYEAVETGENETLLTLQEIEAETRGVLDGLDFLTAPAQFAAQHSELLNQAQRMVTAAGDMIVGLQSADTGEARNAALVEYTDAATTFVNVVDSLDAPPVTTTTAAGGTTTTGIVDSTSTTVTPTTLDDGATTTTVAAQGDGDGGGTSMLTIVLVLILGALVGGVVGLLIGASARRELMRQLRIARGDHPPGVQR